MAARITRMTKRRLGELLQAEGLITEEQVQNALAEQRKENLFLGEAMIRLGYVTDFAIAGTIAQSFNLPFLALEQCKLRPELVDLFPQSLLREYQFIPFDKLGDVVLIVGAGLMNHDMLDELERLGGCKVCQYVSTWFDIRNEIDKLFEGQEAESQDDFSDLGSMLLGDDEDGAGGDLLGEEPSMSNSMVGALEAEVNAMTGGSTTDVLEEALAAVDPGTGGGGASSTPLPAPSTLSSGVKMSAFAKKKPSAFAAKKEQDS